MAASRPNRPGRGQLVVVAVAAVALAAALAAPSASAAGPRVFWGVAPQHTPTTDQFLRLKRGGVDSVRAPLFWSPAQPTPGAATGWGTMDDYVKKTASVGMEILPFVYGSPRWVTRPESRLPINNGRQRRAWMGFLKQAVRRYGPQGTFWAENPDVPRRPVRTWQIWNEPNFFYFAKRPDPGRYGQLVKLSHRAISSVDPKARLILGGMFSLPRQRPPRAYDAFHFLTLMYKRHPGIKRFFEGIAIHPYTSHFKYLRPILDQVRAAVKRAGDPGVNLWITEIGWGSQGGRQASGFEKGRRGQVIQMRGAFRTLLRFRNRWRVKRIHWFSVDDVEGSCNFCDSTGLFAEGFRPKPAWHMFTRFSGGRPR